MTPCLMKIPADDAPCYGGLTPERFLEGKLSVHAYAVVTEKSIGRGYVFHWQQH